MFAFSDTNLRSSLWTNTFGSTTWGLVSWGNVDLRPPSPPPPSRISASLRRLIRRVAGHDEDVMESFEAATRRRPTIALELRALAHAPPRERPRMPRAARRAPPWPVAIAAYRGRSRSTRPGASRDLDTHVTR